MITILNAFSEINKWIFKEWIYWEKSSNYDSKIFPKQSIVCRIILVVMDTIWVGTFEYFTLNLL